jgi:voltage-gated potassium channel
MHIRSFKIIETLRIFFYPFRLKKDPNNRFQRIILSIKSIRTAFSLVLLSVLIGVAGFRLIEHFSWTDSFFMSIITISTVGFGEVQELSEHGRLFTSILILFNVGLYAYAISTVVSLFAEGNVSKLLNELKMHNEIEALSKHTIICGYGRHSTEVAKELTKQQMPFVVIENSLDKLKTIQEETPYLFIDGDATQDETLKEAGIEQASVIVVTLPDDSDSLFVVLSARQLNPGIRIIARANSLADEIKMKRAGANETVVPEQIGGFFMATLINKPDLVEFFRLLSNMGPSNVMFEEVPVSMLRNQYINKSFSEAGIRKISPVSIIAIRQPKGQYVLNPPNDTLLTADLDLVLVGSRNQVMDFKKQALKKD